MHPAEQIVTVRTADCTAAVTFADSAHSGHPEHDIEHTQQRHVRGVVHVSLKRRQRLADPQIQECTPHGLLGVLVARVEGFTDAARVS